jgi:HPt (histidine-containing phosphotransfer) domain-containing protein
MDGLDAASKIVGMGVKTPIVALTANVMSNDLELYKVSGMSDCVGKPFTSQELWRCLVRFLPVESYSTSDLFRRSEEDEAMRLKLQTNFVRNNQTTYAQIVEALDTGNIKLAHRIAHTLKGNAGQIGEKSLQRAAAAVETYLSKGENQLTGEHLRNVETELQAVLSELAPLLTEAVINEDTSSFDVGKAAALLNTLEPLIKNKDTECLNYINDLYSVPGAKKLIDEIEAYKFRTALASLETLRKEIAVKHE